GILVNNPPLQITGNYIGTNAAGTGAVANGNGITITTSSVTIGGSSAGETNVISGNTNDGIALDTGSGAGLIIGNFIGTNFDGTSSVPNGVGINIVNGSDGNVIGGSTAGERNVISGNTGVGI